MKYIKGEDRRQYVLFPACLDEYVEQDSPVRYIDAFVNSQDLDELGFNHTSQETPEKGGRPPYDPHDMVKLYLYGYFNSIRSSRKLERECKVNIEVMWLICQLTPDFHTIADFRKDNKDAIKKLFKALNKQLDSFGLFTHSYLSIDGSKFKAVNSKDRNFTLNKLDDRIARLEEHEKQFLADLDQNDFNDERKLSKEETERKLAEVQERKSKYEGYRKDLEASGEKQLSLTDPDAKLMKFNEGFNVGFNVQTAVEDGSHLIAGFNVTTNPTDHGEITETISEAKNDLNNGITESVADKGYQDPADMGNALAAGIIPNVIQRDGKSEATVELDYVESEVTEDMLNSEDPKDLEACLKAGKVPTAYFGILDSPKVIERKTYECVTPKELKSMSDEQMRQLALRGYFVRDAEKNLVYCPQGQMLRPKSTKSNGNVRYCNKLACKNCKHKCTTAKFKEADFSKDTLIKEAKNYKVENENASGKDQLPADMKMEKKTVIKKIITYTLHLDQNKMSQRKCLSEHPFGTMKRTLGAYYFLLKTKVKVEAEMALICISYNMRRAISMLGVPQLVAKMA